MNAADLTAAKQVHQQRTASDRQSLPATRVRRVVRLDLGDLVDRMGELGGEARSRIGALAVDVRPGQAVVIDLGDATWAGPWTLDGLADALQDASAVQIQGARGAFVDAVAAQIEAALR